MEQPLNLLEETLSHFHEGARSVRAYTENTTLIITRATDTEGFWIAQEEPGFPKQKTASLENHFQGVFGIEAKY